jgi:hypothetical protein
MEVYNSRMILLSAEQYYYMASFVASHTCAFRNSLRHCGIITVRK